MNKKIHAFIELKPKNEKERYGDSGYFDNIEEALAMYKNYIYNQTTISLAQCEIKENEYLKKETKGHQFASSYEPKKLYQVFYIEYKNYNKLGADIEFAQPYYPILYVVTNLEYKPTVTGKTINNQSTLITNSKNNKTTMATTKTAKRTALGGKPYLNPKTNQPVINQKTGKPYTWSPRAYMTKDKNGNAMVEINMPSTMVKRPNNFFCTGVKHKNVINQVTGKKDVITYVKGYVRLNRKTTNGHDARLYYVAREFYMGGKPGIFDIHYKGDNYYRAEDIFNDIPFHDGWIETYNKKQNKNYQMGIKSDGTRKSQIEYVNKRRQEYRTWKTKNAR